MFKNCKFPKVIFRFLESLQLFLEHENRVYFALLFLENDAFLARVRVMQDIVTSCEKAMYGFGLAFLWFG